MQQILKRLELIKTSIEIDDLEIIELQINKLQSLQIDDEVNAIIAKLNDNDFGTAIVELEEYIKKFSGVVVYEDKEIQGLKLELKVLEAKLQKLSSIKSDYLHDINEFNTQYNLKLGEIISKILEKEKEIVGKQVQENPEDEELKEAYEEASSNYEEFSHDYQDVVNEERYELSVEEEKELKKLFRKAARLCHPDIVAEELREQAKKIIQKLNDAYAKKDLEVVKEILYSLENGLSFDVASDTINDKEILRVKITELRIKIDVTFAEINEITEDETFIIIQDIDDWDVYFSEKEEQLEERYENMLD